MEDMKSAKLEQTVDANWLLLFSCWLIAASSTLGSLFFSEIMQYAPCVLCWYQRILMYPLVVIILIGSFPLDKSIIKYALPLAAIGAVIALYHNLIYYGFIPESIQPCSRGVSCAEIYPEIFGVLTIPLLSLAAFLTIVILLIILKRRIT